MMALNLLAVFTALFVCTSAQKPFYASSAQYPPVLPQNMPNNTDDLGNRFGENSTTQSNIKNPVYNVEQELIDRVKEYPRDKQPYWYLNAAQLNAFKNPQQPQQVPQLGEQQQQQQLQRQQQQWLLQQQQQRQFQQQQQLQQQQQQWLLQQQQQRQLQQQQQQQQLQPQRSQQQRRLQ